MKTRRLRALLLLLLFVLPATAFAGETAAGTVVEIAGVGSFVILSSLFLSWRQMPPAARASILRTLLFWKR